MSTTTEPMREAKATPKRKHEDESDGEGHSLRASVEKRRRLYVPRGEATEPSILPIPNSCYDRYMSVNLAYSPLPKYKKQKFQDLVTKIKFKSFLRDTYKLRRDAKVLPLTRFEMEAALYQLVYGCWKSKGVGLEEGATEMAKFGLKHFYIQKALDQRRNFDANDWWKLQKEKHPDLDIEIRHDDPEADRLQNCVEKWEALLKDGEDPVSVHPFNQMSPAEFNFIKITYENSLPVDPSVAGGATINLTPKKQNEIGADEDGKLVGFTTNLTPKKKNEMGVDENGSWWSWRLDLAP